ncbi:uncharacterized protein RAG0_11066 [Rhynchosporium agropyri]|uniref:Uncharacterized protein n=1 Tax=Rhynchosporium agropyri TaxID=914238 RepID=A0A1E1L2F1_9HELO|nr:uncharacterized protein RAG0_11066 [Rhynchosporium agropyri]
MFMSAISPSRPALIEVLCRSPKQKAYEVYQTFQESIQAISASSMPKLGIF